MAVVNVKSEIAGNVWKIQLKPGDKVELEGEIMILESMKMEIPVLSPKAAMRSTASCVSIQPRCWGRTTATGWRRPAVMVR